MSLITIDTKDLKTILERYTKELFFYCIRVENNDITLLEKETKSQTAFFFKEINSCKRKKGQKQI